MKLFIILFTIALSGLISSCNSCYSRGGPPFYNKIRVGTLFCHDSTSYWIDSLSQNFDFVNDSGNSVNSKFSRIENSFISQNFGGEVYIEEKSKCEQHFEQKIIYYVEQQYMMKLNSYDVMIQRTKEKTDISSLNYLPENINKIRDALYVTFNKYSFLIQPRSNHSRSKYQDFDTIRIGSNLYDNVVYMYTDTVGLLRYRTEPFPYGIYYHKTFGILRVNMSDGKWYGVR